MMEFQIVVQVSNFNAINVVRCCCLVQTHKIMEKKEEEKRSHFLPTISIYDNYH